MPDQFPVVVVRERRAPDTSLPFSTAVAFNSLGPDQWRDAMHKVIVEDGGQRQHRQWLRKLLETTNGPVRVASAYVTDRDLLFGAKNRKVQLLTSLLRMDVISGATSLEALKSLIETGVQCRCLPDDPKTSCQVLHLRRRSCGRHIGEPDQKCPGPEYRSGGRDYRQHCAGTYALVRWLGWSKAALFDLAQVSVWQQQTASMRREYSRLRKKIITGPKLPNEVGSIEVSSSLRELLDNTKQSTFLCNTDGKHGGRYPELVGLCGRS